MALALGFAGIDASALTLGRLNVQSTLGEPLRAEIEVTDLSAAEADGLKISIGSPESFRTAGIAYSPALTDVRTSLQKRPDGRFVIRLNGSRSMNDPFLDLLLEANWNSGRIVRDYTVLLDPPAATQAAASANQIAAQTPAQTGLAAAPAAPPAVAGAGTAAVAAAPVAPTAIPTPSASAPKPTPVPKPRAASPPADPATVRISAGEQVTVQRGDTASKIAAAYKPADVSLDQMLVALLRGNADAFIGGNVHRLKAGAVLALPSDEQARAATPAEAYRTVKTQSNDFGEYRRRLAENAPASRASGTERQASGKLQASVEERNAPGASPDKLRISQGNATAMAADEKLAQNRQAQATNSRADELAKNLSDLKKLQSASGVATAPADSASAATTLPGVPAGLAVPVVAASASAPATTASDAAPGSASAAASDAASAAVAAAKPKIIAAPPAPVVAVESGFIASLLGNPLMLGVAGLLAALVALVLYRVMKQRRRPDVADSVFLESKMPSDSFFGVSGGEQVDTADRPTSVASSLAYSPSQLDSGDVDPVAEADVYLAYGRDLQAEEILREAMRLHPDRVAIPLKMLEIHASRRDMRAFEALTGDVRKLTGGVGPEWARAVELGRELDPGNALYQTGGFHPAESGTPAASKPIAPVAPLASAPPPFIPSVAPLDFDLDLLEPIALMAPAAAAPIATAPSPLSANLTPSKHEAAPAYKTTEAHVGDDFDTVRGAFAPPASSPLPYARRPPPAALQAIQPKAQGPIEFDVASLSKLAPRIPDAVASRHDAADDASEHPHAIKLSLARELQAIGDTEGARSLVQEVASEASGELQAKARQLLTQLAS